MEKYSKSFDELVISLLEKDNPGAMDLLYTRYAPALQQTAGAILTDPAAAEDIVQDLLLNIWQKRHLLHLKYPLNPYLHRAVYNRCLNHIRKFNLRRSLKYPPGAGIVEPDAEVEANTSDLRARIKATKALLPHRTKMAFILSRSFKMTYKEIAAFMGISEKGVEKHLRKARRSFERMYQQYLKAWPVILLMYEKLKDCFF